MAGPLQVADAEGLERRIQQAAAQSRTRRILLLAAGWLALLAIWQLASTLIGHSILPSPVPVAARMTQLTRTGEVLHHFQASFAKILAGLAGAIFLGCPIGYVMGRSRWWRAFFADAVNLAGLIPPITFAILSLIIFGISTLGPVLAVVLVAFPYIAFNVSEGVQNVDEQLVKMSQTFGRTAPEIRRHVVIPFLVPFLLAAVRLSFAIAWKVEALTEVFGGRRGIGFQMRFQFALFDVEGMLAWMLLFVGFMLVVERVVLAKLEDRLLAWRPAERVRQ